MRKPYLIPACLVFLASCSPRYQAHFGKSGPVAYGHRSAPADTLSPAVLPVVPAVAPPTPELIVSTADRLVAAAGGTAYERRALKISQQLRAVASRTSAGKTGSDRSERRLARQLTRKVQHQVARAGKLQKAQAVNSGVKTGLLLLLIGLLLTLLVSNAAIVVVGLVLIILGAIALIVGLFDTL